MRIAFTHNLQTSHDETQAEFDKEETVVAIADALQALGHHVTRVDVGGSAAALVRTLEDLKPDLVFNTAEGSHGRFREAFFPALFEQMGLPYTGSDAWVCALTLDKQLSKMMVARAGVPTPKWVFIDEHTGLAPLDQALAGPAAQRLRLPVIIKPNFEGSSKGITQDSIVEDAATLRARAADILSRYPSGLLVEEYIVGRDVVVPFLEGTSVATNGVLTPASYRIDAAIAGERKYAIYDYALKGDKSDAVSVECPAPVTKTVAERLRKWSQVAFRALGMRDLGRIDWRITDDGDIYFLEVNALPSLEPGAGIYLSAALAGLKETSDVLGAVIASAAKRNSIEHLLQRTPSRQRLRVGLTYNLKRKAAKHEHDDDAEAEYDSEQTIAALANAIRAQGVDVVRLEATPDVMRRLPDADLDLVFNMAEGLHGRGRECHVPAMLEMLDVTFTGSDSVTMALALDKALAKGVVRDVGVATARDVVVQRAEDAVLATQGMLQFPLLVKPNAEGSSKGVLERSVVTDVKGLSEAVDGMVKKYHQPVLVEEFLPGREFTVALVGDQRAPRVLPPMEIVFIGKTSKHPVYSFGHKLDWSTQVRYDRPAQVSDALRDEIIEVARRSWHALGCRDVARIDMRQNAAGQVCFIECNPLPGLTPNWSDLCMIAESAGLSYTALIGEIMAPAFARRDARLAQRAQKTEAGKQA